MEHLSRIFAKAGLTVDNGATFNGLVNANTDTDRFLVADNGVLKFRTGAEILSDIGGASSASGLPIGGTAGQILAKIDATNYNTEWIDNFTTDVRQYVKAGEAINKGQAVYISSADGTNPIVSKASNASEATSSKTLGLLAQNLSHNGFGYVITEGRLSGLDTSSAQIADPVWLGTNGNLIFGLANKPIAPAHLVYLGVVTRVNANNGEIFVHVQNGVELNEIHDVLIQSVANKDIIYRDASTNLWKNASIATVLGFTPADNAALANYQLTSQKAQPNGYASLDGNGKVPLAQMNDSIIGQVEYMGLWNAATNTPTLSSTPQQKGHYYIVSAAGTQFGISFEIGDWIISNGTGWDKVDNTDAVNSVFGRVGNIAAAEADYQSFYPRLSQVYANPSWISELAWSKITGTPTTLAGYGITDAVPSSRTITINGTTYDLSANRTWTISEADTLATVTARGNTTSANVIIGGTTDAGFKLDVVGTFRASGDATLSSLAGSGSRMVVANSSGVLSTQAIPVGTVTSVGLTTGISGTDVNVSGSPVTGSGVITLNIPTASATNRGVLSSADWTSFNSKEPAIASGTTSQYWRGDKSWQTLNTTAVTEGTNLYYTDARARLALSSAPPISYDSGTGVISITQSSGNTNGFLSSTDWTTFNNKVGGSGTINYLSKFTASGTIGNSQLFDNGTNVEIGYGSAQGLYKLDVNGSVRVNTNLYVVDAIGIGVAPNTNRPLQILKNLNTTVGIRFENTNTGANAFSALQMGEDINATGTKFVNFLYVNSSVSRYGAYVPQGTSLINVGSGGLNLGTVGGGISFYNALLSKAGEMFSSGNWYLGTGLTPTDAGFRLDVSGTFRTSGNSVLALSSGAVLVGTSTDNLSGAKLQVSGAATFSSTITATRGIFGTTGSGTFGVHISDNDQSNVRLRLTNTGTGGQAFSLVGGNPGASNAGFAIYDETNAATRLYISSTGNLGLGVTPSAWGSTKRALQIGSGASYYGDTSLVTQNFSLANAYFDGTNLVYLGTGEATQYRQNLGAHSWWNAPSGTAGNAITFTQAMTLDASGNLGIGLTSPVARLHAENTSSADPSSLGVTPTTNVFGMSTSPGGMLAGGIGATGGTYVWLQGRNKGGAGVSYPISLNPLGGNVGIGTTAPAAPLQVAATGVAAYGTIGIRGTSAHVAFRTAADAFKGWVGYFDSATHGSDVNLNIVTGYNVSSNIVFKTNGDTGQAMIITSSNNVGIGTTSPSYPLTISRTISATQTYLSFNNATNAKQNWGIDWDVLGTPVPVAAIRAIYPADNDISLAFYTYNGSGNVTERMRINVNGNVGIGVTPSAWSTFTAMQIKNASFAGQANFAYMGANYYYDGTNNRYIASDFASRYQQFNGIHQWLTASSGTAGNIITFTGAMTLDASGNLGIGTTSPAEKLELSGTGNVYSKINSTNAGNAGVRFNSIGAREYGIFSDGALRFYDFTAGAERMRITSGGLVGIGTTSPGGTLDVAGALSSSRSFIRITNTDTNNYVTIGAGVPGISNAGMNFTVDATTRMIISSSGSVGIGTTSPLYKLDVNGIASISTSNTSLNAQNSAFYFNNTYPSNYALASISYGTEGQFYYGYLAFNTITTGFANVLTERMRITQAGNVGIGISSPSQLLDVRSANTSGATGATIRIGSQNHGNSGDEFANLEFYWGDPDAAEVKAKIYTKNVGNVGPGGGGAADLLFATTPAFGSSTERLRITSSGNVGIGTASPTTYSLSGTHTEIYGGSTYSFLHVNTASVKSFLAANESAALTALFTYSNHPLTFGTNNAERLRITSSGNVLIGNTAGNGYKLEVFGSTQAGNTFGQTFAGVGAYSQWITSGGAFAMGLDGAAGATERMRITSGGDVLVNTTSVLNGSKFTIDSSTTWGLGLRASNNGGVFYFQQFFAGNTQVGTITSNGTSTTYSTSSDYRLKTDLKDFAGIDIVNLLKVYDYEWKSDKSRSYGVLAHELQSVIPYAVTGMKDGEMMQGVDYSKIVPVLVKAIQELKTELDTLKK